MASAEFKPSDGTTDSVGTVAVITPQPQPEAVSFWVQVPTGTLPDTR
jgi:hypothetical protein